MVNISSFVYFLTRFDNLIYILILNASKEIYYILSTHENMWAHVGRASAGRIIDLHLDLDIFGAHMTRYRQHECNFTAGMSTVPLSGCTCLYYHHWIR